jgi:ABC-type branched-subunit amino acid transport system substrate-binding protein
MRRGLATVVATLSLGLTACGSTVSQTAQGGLPGAVGNAPNGLGQTAGAPLNAGSGVGGETSLTPSAVTGGTGTGSGGSAGGGGVDPATASGSGAPLRVDYARPATGSPVEVGIMYIADLGAAATQFGGGGGKNNEKVDGQREYMQAAVDWMNAHGGLGGHKIRILYYGAQIAGSKSYEQSQSEMCAMMTEDHKAVAAVISNITVTNTMAQCMEKAKGLYVTDAGYFKTSGDWRSLSYTASPTELDSEVLGRELAELTIAKGAARSGDKVGLVVYDAPGYRAAEAQYTKVAKASGIETMSYRITYANSTPELSNSIAAVQSAVLAFQSAGVKTVVSLSSGGIMGFFLTNADNQHYYPRYVFSSNDGPVNAPAAAKNNQLRGAIALATVPTMDVNLLQQPALFSDPTFATCRQINKQFPAASESTANFNISQRLCMSLLLIQTGAKGYGGSDITGTTLRDGVRKVGSGISAGATYRTLLMPGKQWAPAQYRSMRYDEAKNLFVYDSGFLPLS